MQKINKVKCKEVTPLVHLMNCVGLSGVSLHLTGHVAGEIMGEAAHRQAFPWCAAIPMGRAPGFPAWPRRGKSNVI